MFPKCMFCDREVIEGHLTCGDVACNESTARDVRNDEWRRSRFVTRDEGDRS